MTIAVGYLSDGIMWSNRVQSGVVLILLSMSLTPIGDALSKDLGQTQSPVFIVFLRYLIAGLIALFIARAMGRKIHFPVETRAHMVLRTALVMGAMTLLIVSLSMVPLANAVGGFLIAPIVAMILSVLFFDEHLTMPRLIGSGISFLGALLILKPTSGIEIGMVISLAGGAMLGAFLAFSRMAPDRSDPVSALVIQSLMGAAMIMPFSFIGFKTVDYHILWPVITLGGLTAATHFLTVVAYQRSDAARLAPFFYFNLIAAVVIGFFWFGEIPDITATSGLSLIVVGGLASLISVAFFARGAGILHVAGAKCRDYF